MTKLLFLGLHRPNEALKTYVELLKYTKSAVTRNYSEKSINGILDYVGGGKGGLVEVDVLEKFYQATRKALEEAKNEAGTPHTLQILILKVLQAPLCQDQFETCEALARSQGVYPSVQG